MKLIEKLFPFKLHLTILQLEGYNLSRFLSWYFKNLTVRKLSTKKGLKITEKIKLLIVLACGYWLISVLLILLLSDYRFGLIFAFLTINQPPLLILPALLFLKPYEIINRQMTINKTRKKIVELKKNGLKIIAITGSFGKSSTKEILYQFLKDKYPTLKTPHSYNTLFGIAKVVNLELDSHYKYFICEMGAYKKGEIKELCQMVLPDLGILAGITSQHLERFGSLTNTVQAKFELVDYLKSWQKIVFNLDDENIQKQLRKRKIKKPIGYSIEKPKTFIKADNFAFGSFGSRFQITINQRQFSVKSKLFGFANVANILAAFCLAVKLERDIKTLISKINQLEVFENRSELKPLNNSIIVDNTYSSNITGFESIIKTAGKISGSKVLVTPGIVELGPQEAVHHFRLGEKSQAVFDHLVLVGKNKRTIELSKGFNQETKTEFIDDSYQDYFAKIKQLNRRFKWIFLENDLTQNY